MDVTIIQLGFILGGSLYGPLIAIFTLGLFTPWCNAKVTTRFLIIIEKVERLYTMHQMDFICLSLCYLTSETGHEILYF